MLRSVSDLMKGYRIEARDVAMGTIRDVLIDDRHWTVRYLVADTRRWLPGRKVLVPPFVMKTPDWEERSIPVEMTREQVEKCPSIAEDAPVSRQHEAALYRHFRWNPYWTGPAMVQPPLPGASATTDTDGDEHLRSAGEVIGYSIEANDGEIGHVEDLVVETSGWTIPWVAVDTGNWLPGRKVLVSPAWLRSVRWNDRTVVVDMTKKRIENGPTYDPSAPVNVEMERQLYDYYGRPTVPR